MALEVDGHTIEVTTTGYLVNAEDWSEDLARKLAAGDGLELAESMKPDIILLDLMMPEMTGDQMLTELRKTPWGKNIKVIILTNMGEQEIPQSIKEMDVSGIILKADMTPRQVAEMVKKQLG